MSDRTQTAFVGIGSNLDRPEAQVACAVRELRTLSATRLLDQSPLYRSTALGPAGQADYVNAVAMLETGLAPHRLLDGLQEIERRHGRVRGQRWGPRTLDLDLLLYGEQRIASARLQVPHPEMHRRSFVLIPLHDIAPQVVVPGQGVLADLLAPLPKGGLWRLADTGHA